MACGLSEALSVKEILHQAEQLEKKYDWVGAADSYNKTLALLSENGFSRKADVTERLGYALYHFAFQAETPEEFRERMHQAALSHEKAAQFYAKTTETEKGRVPRCEAMIAYIGYWLASEVSEKKRLLDECWRLTKEVLKDLDKTGNAFEYGKTYNQLSSSAAERYCFESSFESRKELIEEAIQYGERAIILLSKTNATYELAKTYVKTALYLSTYAEYLVSDMDEKEDCYRKGLDYWQKANKLSEETAFLELLRSPYNQLDWTIDNMLIQYGRALEYARKTKDRYLIGTSLEVLKYATGWTRVSIEDPDKTREIIEKVLQYAKDARHQFSIISYASPYYIGWIGAAYANYYVTLAFYETDLRKKRDLLEKARVEYANAVKQAENDGYPHVIGIVHDALSACSVSLAKTETSSEQKRKLLESANEHRKISMELSGQLERFNYWNLGQWWMGLANLRAELSQIEMDNEKKKNMLEEAVSYGERGLQLLVKYASHREKKGDLINLGPLGLRQYLCGERLHLLYGLTHNDEDQKKALKAFKDSAESFQKVNLVSRVAESCWRIARVYDALGEHLKAAENFNLASDNYKRAVEKIPQLKDLFQDHASYMEAWNAIEKARHHHAEKQYGQAKEHYEKAADLHKSTKRWNYLGPNYLAWARLEEGEDLSRREQTEESKDYFQKAAELFAEAKKSLQTKLEKIDDRDEKESLVNLAKASDIREEYCLGRIALEEAKILDKQGDHAASSRKYGAAADRFQGVADAMKDESDRQELKPIIYLCQAWQTMTRAEAEASPDLYKEASKLFEEAKDYSLDEKAKMLALGHSRFCLALEAGTRYEDSRDTSLHTLATQHLESAASYYLKAGFKNASEYAEATQKLLDAYLYMHNAKTQTDPTKKAQFYMMAEKVLQASAGSYLKAKHPEKQEQVSTLLEKVKNERELALSLTEVLHAPLATSTTATFTTPTPSEETPTGLERFENADVQANLIVRQKELKVGEDLRLEIELVNAGKGPALLIKVNEVIPQGFELIEKQDVYRVEDSYINLRGRRLDPLKTEDVKLVLKPKVQGTFVLKPTVLYLDENGKYKSHEPESVTIVIKELGIKGWIKGER
jgi:hypothetical protein